MHIAARDNPSVDVIHALVDNGADVDARDNHQWTPLHWAALYNEGVVKALLARNANVNLLSGAQRSPLSYAAERNNREAIVELCQAGAKPRLGKNNPLDYEDIAVEMKMLIREKCLSL